MIEDIEETTINPWEGLQSLLSGPTTFAESASGVLTLQDLEAVFEHMKSFAIPDAYVLISPSTKRRWLHIERIAALYARTKPHTRRKLRKAVAARVQARIEQGKRRIARIERRELKEERRIIEGL